MTQQKIGEGLQRNTLAIDHSQLFLARLEGIRHDYLQLRGRSVRRDQWDRLDQRLDALNRDIDRAIDRPGTIGGADLPRDRINVLQQRINSGRASGRLSPREVQKFQATLDFIRRDYIRMTEGDRYPSYEERTDISRRLDYLEADLNKSL
ncbi:MAG: hypothetical protein SCH71_06845 [Desulfobulbaceae bacterium]|nr:hypothetical protein [Desulfobulbaceae bacterium]